MRNTVAVLSFIACIAASHKAAAWGDDGHKTVALIAQQCLTAPVRKQVTGMLAADVDDLTKHDIASAATWADKYRDSNHLKDHYIHTRNWHIDIEIGAPDQDAACFGHPALPSGTLATAG
jgi:hypothetical protein